MALPIKIRRVTREELAIALGNNHRVIKAFEDLINDIIAVIVPAVEGDSISVEVSQDQADTATAAVAMAEGLATLALMLAESVTNSPPAVPPIVETIINLEAQVGALREEVAALTVRISQLESAPP